MGQAKCQCIACACSADAATAASEGVPDVNHNHARLASVLRYRGLENEAAMAARMVKVERLMGSLRSVLDDLDDSMAAWVASPANSANAGTEAGGNEPPHFDPQALARQHVRLVERLLETALLKIHSDFASAGDPFARSQTA